MGKDLSVQFKDCLARNKIRKIDIDLELIDKELRVSENDLNTAKSGLTESRWKWCTIQSYYSIFQTARALIYSEGYREKSHYCLRTAVEVLFVENGKLDISYIDAFQTAKMILKTQITRKNFPRLEQGSLSILAKIF